jgi:predicted transcriptional regulator
MDARTVSEKAQGRGANRVGDFMDPEMAIVGYGGSVDDALNVMLRTGRRSAVVMDGDYVVGLIGASDIASMVARDRQPKSVPVRDFMSACLLTGNQPCVQVRDDDTVADALKVMDSWGTDQIIVVDENNRAVGTISALDALRGWKEKVYPG